jgi:pyridoxine 5-phosphate synthase
MERVGDAGVRVSLFIDPDPDVVRLAAKLGAAAVEFHTGDYAGASPGDRPRALERLRRAVATALDAGVAIHAGHGLTYRNVQPVAAIREIEELNIGHSIVSRSITVGLEAAVREMRTLITTARAR